MTKAKKSTARRLPKKGRKLSDQTASATPRLSSIHIQNLAGALLLAICTFLVYRGSLNNDFVNWDDHVYVLQNDLVRSSIDIQKGFGAQLSPHAVPGAYDTSIGDIFRRAVSSNYHPLTILTMRWNNNVCADCIYKISARPFILWNVILHILNSILVFLLLIKLSRDKFLICLVLGMVFALHPMHVESVAWVSERKDVLYTFFILLATMTYIAYIQHQKKRWLVLTFASLFILSLKSRRSSVSTHHGLISILVCR